MRTGRALAVACSLLAPGCQVPAQEAVVLPAGPQVVEVAMTEHRFDYLAPAAPGRVLFRLRNTGTVPHSLSMLPLPEGIPPIGEQLRGTVRRALGPIAGVGALEPGATTTFAVDLAPGVRYAFVCFLLDDAGESHAVLGMNSEFRTGPAAAEGGTSG